MKTIVIASGHLGSTVKAAGILAAQLGCDVFDTLGNPSAGLETYDTYVFGSNIRMFRLNGRFKRWAKKLKKTIAGRRVFAYLVGIDRDHAGKYIEKAKKLLPTAVDVRFVRGELCPEKATGFAKAVITSQLAECQKQGKPPPCLDVDALSALAQEIARPA